MLQIIKLKLANVISVVTASLPPRVGEYVASGRDKIIVPNKIFAKRKARECSISLADSSTQIKGVSKVNYPG